MSDSNRRFRKRKAREREVAGKKLMAARSREYADHFPQFVFKDEGKADPAFVKLIRRAAVRLRLNDRSIFQPQEIAFYKQCSKYDSAITKALRDALDGNAPAMAAFACRLGQILFDQVPSDLLRRYIPYNDANVVLVGRKVYVAFRSLLRQSGPNGTIYYSHHRPTLLIDGCPRIVGFSRHAIERICKRLGHRWDSYAGLGDVYAFLDQNLRFDRCDLTNGQLCYSFYAECAKGFFSELYLRRIIGSEVENDGTFYYRVGYCPVVIEGEFIKATTLYVPGYAGTPEFETIRQADLPYRERRELMEKARKLTGQELVRTGDFSLLKFFHEHGVPQVIRSETPLYAPAAWG